MLLTFLNFINVNFYLYFVIILIITKEITSIEEELILSFFICIIFIIIIRLISNNILIFILNKRKFLLLKYSNVFKLEKIIFFMISNIVLKKINLFETLSVLYNLINLKKSNFSFFLIKKFKLYTNFFFIHLLTIYLIECTKIFNFND